MPWQECNPMDERLKFIARLLDGQKMAELCREFGISGKAGLQDPQSLQQLRPGRADRPLPAAFSMARRSRLVSFVSLMMILKARPRPCLFLIWVRSTRS